MSPTRPKKYKATEEEGILSQQVSAPEENEEEATVSPTKLTSNASANRLPCAKCNKTFRKENCTLNCCIKCCDDSTCAVHFKAKGQRSHREQVLAGTTETQLLAADLRRRRVPLGRFKESGFLYTGDTIVLWNLRAYMQNSKWRDDAARKSRRRGHGDRSRLLRNSRRRFRQIMEELYRKSMIQETLSS
jgi:hypothetical protein